MLLPYNYRSLTGSYPSPALVKAALINGADDMPAYTDPVPNYDEGWGRMNLVRTLDPAIPRFYADQAVQLSAAGQTASYYVAVPSSGLFRVTLAWTDEPQYGSCAPACLVNDLDLRVTNVATGDVWVGNTFFAGRSMPSTGWTPANPTADHALGVWDRNGDAYDDVNNVENIFVQAAGAGWYRVDVSARSLPAAPQDFALVVLGASSTAPSEPSEPRNLTATPGKHTVTLAWEPPADDGGSPLTGYKVYRDGVHVGTNPPNDLDYMDSGLRAGQTYCYRVSATNAFGEGPPSNEACATPLAELLLEAEAVWTESLGGDTLVRAVYSANVDADADIEILAVGEADIGPPQPYQAAQLTIWTWNGSALTQEWEYLFAPNASGAASFHGVYVDDFDGDGTVEIFAAGWGGNETVHLPILCRFWWNVSSSAYETDGCLTRVVPGEFLSVHGAELGGDAAREVIVAGRDLGGPYPQGWLMFWTWNGTVSISDEVLWTPGSDTGAYSVYAANVDGDGRPEIMTAGYTDVAGTRHGELRVWDWDGTFTLQGADVRPDSSGGPAELFSVFAADANIDGTVDIVACGYSHDAYSGRDQGLLRLYRATPTFGWITDTSWVDGLGTRCHSVYGMNMTDDRELELVTGGWSTKADGTYGELRLWRVAPSGLDFVGIATPRQWRDHGGLYPADVIVNGVFARDVDGDGVVEVVSGGQGSPAAPRWEAQLRVWYDP